MGGGTFGLTGLKVEQRGWGHRFRCGKLKNGVSGVGKKGKKRLIGNGDALCMLRVPLADVVILG